MNDYKMTPGERRATWGLGTVFSLRMLGMFMVLPVLTTYGMALQGASEALIGIAIGIYGLTQAVFQIPFGLLSDRIGRKPLIVGGLAVFAAGSVIAALSDSIWGIILGRALQGSGAIAAAVMALLSDLTREQNRTPRFYQDIPYRLADNAFGKQRSQKITMGERIALPV